MNIANLKPGEQEDFLGLTFRFLLPEEKLSRDVLFSPITLCDGKLDSDYIAKAYRSCPYKIIIGCSRKETVLSRPKKLPSQTSTQWGMIPPKPYEHNDMKGVIGICFAKPYLDGIYISLICASTYYENKIVSTKLGLILQVTMLNFAVNHLGLKNAYNDAANKDLVKYYSKLGWVLSNQPCDVDDPLAIQFQRANDFQSFMNSVQVDEIKTNHGYPMRLCNINPELLTRYLVKEIENVQPVLAKLLQGMNGLCLPKQNFAESLVDKTEQDPSLRKYKNIMFDDW